MAVVGTIARSLISKTILAHTTKLGAVSANTKPIGFYSTAPSFEYIKTDVVGTKKNVAVVTLNRPKALNALCNGLVAEVSKAVSEFDADDKISAIIITGNEKAFAAGADIKEMFDKDFSKCVKDRMLADWDKIGTCGKPVIAAVNGFALGGGMELAMLCDIVYAGDKAKFGQPEIALGTIPGAGGTQRLTRVAGKSKAMEIVLTGNFIDAQEAEKIGIASKVVPADKLLEETIKLAEKISTHSPLTVRLAKDSVNAAYETTLTQGLLYEKKVFYGTFSTNDRREGMSAFIEKRAPNFKNE